MTNPTDFTERLHHLNTLRRFQAWRTGKDERTMDEAGIVPAQITQAIDWAIKELEDHPAEHKEPQ